MRDARSAASVAGGSDVFLVGLPAQNLRGLSRLISSSPLTHIAVNDVLPGDDADDIFPAEGTLGPSLRYLSYNSDNRILSRVMRAFGGPGVKKIGIGYAGADVKISETRQILSDMGEPALSVSLSFNGKNYICDGKLFGLQFAKSVASSFALALELGTPAHEAVSSMARAVFSPETAELCRFSRIHRTVLGGFLIDESYDANPDAVSCSLKNIIETRTPGDLRKYAVLGGIRGLGEESLHWHEVVMSRASLLDGVFLIGGEWDDVVTVQSSLRGKWQDIDDFVNNFDPAALCGAITLLNGSGYYEMGKILSLLSMETERCR
jgi:UDP-N-acetylmuramyl pentapeptide synthase